MKSASNSKSKEGPFARSYFQDRTYQLFRRLENRLRVLYCHAEASGTDPSIFNHLQRLYDYYNSFQFCRLDITDFMDHRRIMSAELTDLFKEYPDHQSHCEALFGFYAPHRSRKKGVDAIFWHLVAKQARKASNGQAMFRLVCEAFEKRHQGWYPIFNTLTVAPEHLDKVFEKGSRCWRNHIRKVKRAVQIEVYGSVREAQNQPEVLTYFACVERGSETGRLHIHCLMWLKALPAGWRDPNSRFSYTSTHPPAPALREIQELKEYWNYGFSSPIAVRTSADDPYSKLGWRFPVARDELGNYSAIKTSDIRAICYYVVKYLVKDQDLDLSGGKKLWRLRQTRNHGLNQLKAILNKLTQTQILQLMRLNRIPIQMFDRWIPTRLIKRLMVKVMLSRMKPRRIHLLLMAIKPKATLLPPSRCITKMRPLRNQLSSLESIRPMSSKLTAGFKVIGRGVADVESRFNFNPNSLSVPVFGGSANIYHGT